MGYNIVIRIHALPFCKVSALLSAICSLPYCLNLTAAPTFLTSPDTCIPSAVSEETSVSFISPVSWPQPENRQSPAPSIIVPIS
ncbi:MAG: hypothetical protein JRI88_06040 [Deltaproteobacteria bacterium]|nr:hypothetical protein [Deltaproteobacteria bacterium]